MGTVKFGVDQRAANYMRIEDIMDAFSDADNVNLQWEMRELVALVWGKKKFNDL